MIHVHYKPAIEPPSSLTTQQSSRQQQAQQQQQPMVQQSDQMQQNQDDEWFTDNDELVPPAVSTTAYVLYDFDAKCPEELSVTANEVVTVIEDSSNGWLRVYRGTDTGYIPSAYVQFT